MKPGAIYFLGAALGIAWLLLSLQPGAHPLWFATACAWCLPFLLGHVLARQLPRGIEELLSGNCIREDGTRSAGRTAIENHVWKRFRGNLVAFLIPLSFANLALLLLLNQLVIPLDSALEVNSKYQPELGAVVGAFSSGLESRQQSEVTTKLEANRRMLRQHWPWVGLYAVLLMTVDFAIVKSYLFFLMARLRTGALNRAEQYFLRDLGRAQVSFDMVDIET